MRFRTFSLYTSILLLLSVVFSSSLRSQSTRKEDREPIPVRSVELSKYVGTWYEIAKIPNNFQKKCALNTTATYKLREDGRIDVINRCLGSNGEVNEAKGIARVVDTTSNAKLEVSFVSVLGIHLFWGDYWIIGLEKDYRYAVVGTPSRKYGWILSRTPRLADDDLSDVFSVLREQGYDPKDFIMTEQDEGK